MNRLGNIFYLIGGGTPSTKEETYWGKGTPWISSADISLDGKITPRRSVTPRGINYSTTNIVPKGTVIVVTRVGLGKVAKLQEDTCFSQDIQALIPKDNSLSYSAQFLMLQLFYKMQSMKFQGQGTTISGITKKQLADVHLFLPPLPEQERIVAHIEALFSELDAGVETLKKTKAQLDVYRQAIITEIFKTVYTAKWIRLDQIAEISGGITKGRHLDNGKIISLPYLRVANVQNGFLNLKEIKYIDLKESELSRFLLQEGDVLYTEGGDRDKLGRGTVWHNEIKNCVHQNHVFKARTDPDQAVPQYVSYWSMSQEARNYFYNYGKQSVNLASINKSVLSALKLPLPEKIIQLEIIRAIETNLSVCNNIEQTIDAALEQAKALRHSILKEAFEGEPFDEKTATHVRN